LFKTVKAVNSTNIPIISLRNVATFQGRENHVKARIGTFTGITDGRKTLQYDIYKLGTLTGGAWLDKDPINSVIQYNNTSTSFIPIGELVGGTGLAKIDRDRINLVSGDVIVSIYPGEELHVVAASTDNDDSTLYLRTLEEF